MMVLSRRFLAAVFMLIGFPGVCLSGEQNPGFYFKLSTQFRGAGMTLDVINGGAENNMAQLATDGDVSGQYWRFVPGGDGFYRLTTLFRGSGQCLDVVNGGETNNQVHLVPCGNFSGQLWRVTAEGDYARLSTQFRGPEMCLDIINGGAHDNYPRLQPCGNFSGQLWKITRTDRRVACAISAPPGGRFDGFYAKHCSVGGIPILASGRVSDQALDQAAEIVNGMLAGRNDLRKEMMRHSVKVGIIGRDEHLTDLPEYRDLNATNPLPGGEDWNTRASGGVGATLSIPMVSGSEKNLLCASDDPYRGENVFLHEFSHTIAELGVAFLDPGFNDRLRSTFAAARAAGLWDQTYAATNEKEYWAEGVQSYFDTNLEAIPPNGIHGPINTAAELRDYDPALFSLIDSVFGSTSWRPTCP